MVFTPKLDFRIIKHTLGFNIVGELLFKCRVCELEYDGKLGRENAMRCSLSHIPESEIDRTTYTKDGTKFITSSMIVQDFKKYFPENNNNL